jgi:HSP20 family molecular chaperone IbpA
VAQRRSGFSDAFDEFGRVFDALFDDLLISRWRRPSGQGNAQVADLGDRYEVTMTRLHAEPDQLEIEATDRRLIVRISGAGREHQRVVDFPHHVEAEQVTARFQNQELKIVLPKKRPLKVKVA